MSPRNGMEPGESVRQSNGHGTAGAGCQEAQGHGLLQSCHEEICTFQGICTHINNAHGHTYVHIYVYTCTDICICTYTPTYTQLHTYMHTHAYTFSYTYAHTYICSICSCTHTHTHTPLHSHTKSVVCTARPISIISNPLEQTAFLWALVLGVSHFRGHPVARTN